MTGRTRIDAQRAYLELGRISEYANDCARTLNDRDPADADSEYDARRDMHIRIQNMERAILNLKDAIGPDPVAPQDGGVRRGVKIHENERSTMTDASEARADNPFIADTSHMGEITVRQLMEVVSNKTEFPKGLDTVIRIGDVEGNNGVNGVICLTFHKLGDVVLSIDQHEGDVRYEG